MNFRPDEIALSDDQPNEDYYSIFVKFPLGFDNEEYEIETSIYLNVPHEIDFDIAVKHLNVVSWLYYKIIAFQHIIHILKSKELKENTKLLQSSGFLDLERLIKRARHSYEELVHIYRKYVEEEKLDLEIYYTNSKGRLDNIDGLQLIRDYYFKHYISEYSYGFAVIDYFDAKLIFSADKLKLELDEDIPKKMYYALLHETSTSVFFIYFIKEYLLDSFIIDLMEHEPAVQDAIGVLVDYKDLLNSVKEELIARIPIEEPGKYTIWREFEQHANHTHDSDYDYW